jgi:hypothetical protein
MRGNDYRDLIASYVVRNFGDDLAVYTEVSLGKTIIGKDRKVDIFIVRPTDQRAIAIECKFQDSQGTTDEKIPYALADLEALRTPGCLVYAGEGWSRGVLHSLEASPLAAYCLPLPPDRARTAETRQLDHVLAATFGLWEKVIPAGRRFLHA